MSLPLWDNCKWLHEFEDTSAETADANPLDAPAIPDAVFPLNNFINKRMHLYLGEFYKLPGDALIVGQNEGLSDMEDGNEALFHLAGPEMEHNLQLLAPIQTGESVITKGYSLPVEWVIHAVGPKWDERYVTAADHALFSAYKSSLLLAVEHNAKSLIIACVYKKSKKYPRFEAAHVCLRTVRKFLNHSVGNNFERVMLCVPSEEDYQIYTALMPAYFPRSVDEVLAQQSLLPAKEALGDEWGEIVLQERVLKVSAGPAPLSPDVLEEYKQRASSIEPGTVVGAGGAAAGPGAEAGARSFSATTPTSASKYGNKTGARDLDVVGAKPRRLSDMDEDTDRQRASKLNEQLSRMTREERLGLRFQAMVNDDLEEEDLSDLEKMDIARIVGKDNKGRTVVYLSAAKLKLLETRDPDRVVLALMRVMEPLRCLPFTLIYGVAGISEANHPSPDFVQQIFDLFACRYNQNMHRLIILHATIMFRMYFFFALPFLTTPFWRNYVAIDCIRNLSRYMEVSQLKFPDDVVQYDRNYY